MYIYSVAMVELREGFFFALPWWLWRVVISNVSDEPIKSPLSSVTRSSDSLKYLCKISLKVFISSNFN